MTAPTKAERERLRGLLVGLGLPLRARGGTLLASAEYVLCASVTTGTGPRIAAAVNALPGLLDALDEAEARTAKLEGVVECAKASVEINQALGDKAAENMQRLATAEAERLTLARAVRDLAYPVSDSEKAADDLARRIVEEANRG